jgi:predicted permease
MPLIEGRDFSEADKEGAPEAVVINEAMAKHYFRDKDPIGQKVNLGRPGRRGSAAKTAEIVGVARDAHYFNIQDERQEAIFTPLLQAQMADFGSEKTLVMRTKTDAANIADDIRAVVRRIDPNLPVFDVTTMKEQLAGALSTSRLMATLSSFFGVLALALSAMGLYGLLAYGVTKRTAEIGIRMALGADRRSILKMVLGETTWLVIIGIGAGLGLAWATARFVSSLLYGLSGHDVRVLALSSATLAAVALLAAALPARRAAQVDPMFALRNE